MEKVDYLIVGGGVAGTTAAETIREHDREGSIAIISDEPHRLYSRISLSKANFFLSRIPEERIWLKSESWHKEKNIRFSAPKKAVALDSSKRGVTLDDGATIGYGKLLLAVGGTPKRWGAPGSEKTGVFYMRTLDDAKAIMASSRHFKRAAIIGGGFIGFEMAEMLKLSGADVMLIIRKSHYRDPILDKESGQMIEAALEKGGVEVMRNAEAAAVLGEEKVKGVQLKNGGKISCDMILVGLGVSTPADWIKNAGIAVGRGILTNEYLETSAPDIWAAGDAAEFNDILLGERIQLGNWVNAQTQGRVAGLNMLGKKTPFRLVSCYTTRSFGTSLALVGDVRPWPDRKIIRRGSPEINSYARLIVSGERVIGATLVNRTQELAAITKMIESGIDVSGKLENLTDSNLDLKQLIA